MDDDWEDWEDVITVPKRALKDWENWEYYGSN